MTSIPLVSIICTVYNHEPFLRQCLDGFVKQKTSFPFEAIVHDDVSTDNSVSIIREYAEKYPDIIKPIYEIENQYSKQDGSLYKVINSHLHGKYTAYCEGDDYWIDPLKLQKQVDILEKDASVGMVYTYARIFDQQKDELSERVVGRDGCSFDEILLQNPVPTVTTIYRTDLYKKYLQDINPFPKKWVMADMPMWLYFAAESKVVFLPEITSVYRVLPVSAYHNPDVSKEIRMSLGSFDICSFFVERYKRQDLLPQIKRQHVTSMIYKYLTHNEPVDISVCHKVGRICDCGLKMMLYTLLSLFPITRKMLYRHIKKQ